MKKNNERFWRLGNNEFLGLFDPLFFIYDSQILIYGLFISEIKDKNFLLDLFFFWSLSWALKNKGVRFMVRGCKFVLQLQGIQN